MWVEGDKTLTYISEPVSGGAKVQLRWELEAFWLSVLAHCPRLYPPLPVSHASCSTSVFHLGKLMLSVVEWTAGRGHTVGRKGRDGDQSWELL